MNGGAWGDICMVAPGRQQDSSDGNVAGKRLTRWVRCLTRNVHLVM